MNSDGFRISEESQGLIAKLKDGDISAEKNLILVLTTTSTGRIWTLKMANEKNLTQITKTAQKSLYGKDLTDLLRAVANGDKVLPQKFQEKDFQELTKNPKFRNISRLIPGMESPEHRLSREKVSGAKQRVYKSAKIIGKGLSKINKQGYAGRVVGQGQGDHPYWLREIVFRDTPTVGAKVDIIADGWRQDKDSNLSISEWETDKRNEWNESSSDLEFLPWVAKNTWDQKEKDAWKAAHPGEGFDEKKFSEWKLGQEDKVLILPTWLLKEISGNKTGEEFKNWRDEVIKSRKEGWGKFKDETGLNISFEEHERLAFQHSNSGSVQNFTHWILKKSWKDSQSNEPFSKFVRTVQWNHQTKTGKTTDSFEVWSQSQDEILMSRYKGSNLPISFEEYQKQQDDSILNEPAPFVLLNEKERKIYETTCEKGKLQRNKKPFNTAHEKTLHSGSEYAIFVIGPDQDLYAGSHIGGVFHHSSFLGEGAVLAGGEIKTNEDGLIIELSSKSGHYRPTAEENLFMLTYFENRGVDLSKVKFTTYNSKGGTEEHNALDYLKNLKKKSNPTA